MKERITFATIVGSLAPLATFADPGHSDAIAPTDSGLHYLVSPKHFFIVLFVAAIPVAGGLAVRLRARQKLTQNND